MGSDGGPPTRASGTTDGQSLKYSTDLRGVPTMCQGSHGAVRT